jgi:hypothetical protein
MGGDVPAAHAQGTAGGLRGVKLVVHETVPMYGIGVVAALRAGSDRHHARLHQGRAATVPVDAARQSSACAVPTTTG